MLDLDAIEARAEALKQYALVEMDSGTLTCPMCDGDGEVDSVLFDSQSHPVSIQAFGMGAELEAAEQFVEHAPTDILALCRELRAARACARMLAGIINAEHACMPWVSGCAVEALKGWRESQDG